MFKGISKLLSFTKKVRPDRRTEVRHCGFSQRKYYTKGISPLLATVLLIAATVVTTTMLSGWVSTTMSTTQSTVGNKTSEGVACAAAEIVIDDVYSGAGSGSVARAIVRNSGGSDNLAITSAQLYDRIGHNFTSTSPLPISLNKGQIATINFTFPNFGVTATASSIGNNGTLNNGAQYTLSGKYDSAISLDGSDDTVNFTWTNDGLGGLDQITIAAWIYPNANAASTEGIVVKRTQANGAVWELIHTGGSVQPHVFCSSGRTEGSSLGASAGNWHFVAGIWNNSYPKNISIFVDGTLSLGTDLPDNCNGTMASGNIPVTIGSTPGVRNNFNGMVDEVSIWNRSLNTQELLTVMNNGPSALSANDLKAYWKFDDGKGVLSCPSDFSRVVVTTNCGGVSAEFSKRPKC